MTEKILYVAVFGAGLGTATWAILRSRAEIHEGHLVVINYLSRHVVPLPDIVGPAYTRREVVFQLVGDRYLTVSAVVYGYWLKDLRGENAETRGDRFIRAVMEAKSQK